MAGKGTKPSANHPWRNSICPKVVDWAREESKVQDVTNVTVARPETLRDRRRKYEGGQL